MPAILWWQNLEVGVMSLGQTIKVEAHCI